MSGVNGAGGAAGQEERRLLNPFGPLRNVRALLARLLGWFLLILVGSVLLGLVLIGVSIAVGWNIGAGIGGFLIEFGTWYSRPFLLVFLVLLAITWVVDTVSSAES